MRVPLVRHSRAGGNPVITRTPLDSRLRGNDLLVDSRLRGNDLLVDSRLRGNDLLAWSKGATAWDRIIISSSPEGLKGWHNHRPDLSGLGRILTIEPRALPLAACATGISHAASPCATFAFASHVVREFRGFVISFSAC
jgi:hypothetical protein